MLCYKFTCDCYKFTCDYVNTWHYPTKQVFYLKSVTVGTQLSPSPLKTMFSKGSVLRSAECLLRYSASLGALENVLLNGNDSEDNY